MDVADWQGGRRSSFSGEFVDQCSARYWMGQSGDRRRQRHRHWNCRPGGRRRAAAVTFISTISAARSMPRPAAAASMSARLAAISACSTGGGSIKLSSAKGKINAESGGGSVVLVSGLQGAVLETGGGSIEVEQLRRAV